MHIYNLLLDVKAQIIVYISTISSINLTIISISSSKQQTLKFSLKKSTSLYNLISISILSIFSTNTAKVSYKKKVELEIINLYKAYYNIAFYIPLLTKVLDTC